MIFEYIKFWFLVILQEILFIIKYPLWPIYKLYDLLDELAFIDKQDILTGLKALKEKTHKM